MTKDNIIEMEKEQLVLLINKIAEENREETYKEIQLHLSILNSCIQANYSLGEQSQAKTIVPLKKELSKTLKKWISPDGKSIIDQFVRDLKGGYIGNKKDPKGMHVYVPEHEVRRLSLKQGDWVRANWVSNNFYDFFLKKRIDTTDYEPEICIEEYAVVKAEKHIQQLAISVTQQDNDMAIPVLLPERDVKKLNVKEGDIIDYAYWPGKVLDGRIRRVHRTGIGQLTIAARQKNARDKEKSPKVDKRKRVLPSFQGCTIIVVGGRNDSHQTEFREEVEKRAGNFVFCSGKENKKSFKYRIKRADAVIVFTEYISHEAMHYTKEYCKTYRIPVSYTKKLNKNTFVVRVKQLLKKWKENDESEGKSE